MSVAFSPFCCCLRTSHSRNFYHSKTCVDPALHTIYPPDLMARPKFFVFIFEYEYEYDLWSPIHSPPCSRNLLIPLFSLISLYLVWPLSFRNWSLPADGTSVTLLGTQEHRCKYDFVLLNASSLPNVHHPNIVLPKTLLPPKFRSPSIWTAWF